MKKKFKIIDASTKEKFKLSEGQMIVMNNQGIFFLVGNFRDYDTYVQKLSDVCPKYDVVWKERHGVLCDEFAEVTETTVVQFEMRVYIVCSHTGHYQGVFRSRKEAEDYGKNNVDYGYNIFVEDL